VSQRKKDSSKPKRRTSGGPRINGAVGEALAECSGLFMVIAAFSALLNLLALAPSIYMLQVYDRVIPTGGVTTLLFLSAMVLYALLTMSALDGVRTRLLVRIGVRLDRRLSPLILDRLLSRAASRRPTAQSNQTMRDADVLRQTLAGPASLALLDLPWAPVFIFIAFLLHPILGLYTAVGAGLLILLAWLNERATRRKAEVAHQANASAYALTDATVANAEAVRALGMRQALIARQSAERGVGLELSSSAQFTSGGFSTVTRFVRLCLQSLALGTGAWLVIENKLSAGSIFAVSLLIARALQPIEQIIGSWSAVLAARNAYDGIVELLDETRSEERERAVELPPPQGYVQVENIFVNSPSGAPVLNGLTFDIRPGEILGVIGSSGAGKTTLARVLSGAIAPDSGVVRLDGASYADWDAEVLGSHIGYLPQDSGLMTGTIRDNISRFAGWVQDDQSHIDAEVVRAAKAAGLHAMILRLPAAYQTRLGQQGRGLSAGQGQRVAMARALYGEPALFVLDEPNSHLDGHGEVQLIDTVLAARARGAAIVVIAHRAGVLNIADRLLALRDGVISNYGSREDVVRELADQRKLQNSSSPQSA
jgi:PrtD family type I secretion system ABC transporter